MFLLSTWLLVVLIGEVLAVEDWSGKHSPVNCETVVRSERVSINVAQFSLPELHFHFDVQVYG